jgi:hypothetical protein
LTGGGSSDHPTCGIGVTCLTEPTRHGFAATRAAETMKIVDGLAESG